MSGILVMNFTGSGVTLDNALYDKGIRVGPDVCLNYQSEWNDLVELYGGATSVRLELLKDQGQSFLRVTIGEPSPSVREAFSRAKTSGKWPSPPRRSK